MKGLGVHYLVDLRDCNRTILKSVKRVQKTLLKSASVAGATIVASHFHQNDYGGVSGVVVIAESHISVHTNPKLQTALIDVFTCGPMKCDEAVEFLVEKFGSLRHQTARFDRGMDICPGVTLPHKGGSLIMPQREEVLV